VEAQLESESEIVEKIGTNTNQDKPMWKKKKKKKKPKKKNNICRWRRPGHGATPGEPRSGLLKEEWGAASDVEELEHRWVQRSGSWGCKHNLNKMLLN